MSKFQYKMMTDPKLSIKFQVNFDKTNFVILLSQL